MHRPTTPRADLMPGDLHLLHDLAVLRLVLDGERVPARERLEQKLGADFARGVGRRALVGVALERRAGLMIAS